jgi:outer membrane protein OmpA-like peptidoglycan-associated protein
MPKILALVCAVLAPLAMTAQDANAPAAKSAAYDYQSRWDIFAGYSFFWPDGKASEETVQNSPGSSYTTGYNTNRVGTTESLSYYFRRKFGWQVDSGQHDRYFDASYSNSGILTLQTGPVWRFPAAQGEPISAFIHALGGFADVEGPSHQPYTWGPTFTAGGGFDYQTRFQHLSLRLIQADYEYVHTSFGSPECLDGSSGAGCIYSPGGHANINAARLSAGIVFHAGSIAPPPPITIACSASPDSVFPGDPVSLSATAGGLNPKMNAVYSWSGTGVSGNGTSASVATASLGPGSYTVNCGVKEGKAGKEGLKPWELASGSTTFTVKAFEPPTISCTASPTTIKPGETSTITATGVSPQNRPLTYSFSASSGSVSGSGNSATYSTTGAPTGTSELTCSVSDDKGQTATAKTSVEISAPYVAPLPHTQTLCSINFTNDAKRPMRVDNEAKACLDEVALALQKEPDAKAVVVGYSTDAEKAPPKHHEKNAQPEDIAGQRAVNTKDYLVTEKGIDASRISVATGTTDAQKVDDYLVPSGATFSADVSGTTPVDESVVKPQVRKALPERHHGKKAAAH